MQLAICSDFFMLNISCSRQFAGPVSFRLLCELSSYDILHEVINQVIDSYQDIVVEIVLGNTCRVFRKVPEHPLE